MPKLQEYSERTFVRRGKAVFLSKTVKFRDQADRPVSKTETN